MNNKVLWIFGSIAFLMLLSLLFIEEVIEVTYGDESFYIEEESFEVGWIHSVEKEEWIEVYEVVDDELLLKETRFKTFGAGVPSEGEIIPSTDGYVHMKINRRMKELLLTVSENVQTTLYLSDEIIPLYNLTDNLEVVTIQIKKRPIWSAKR